mmetsp:Transcript_86378/g.241733  ORF Transcript_86378/g.241733 Transcript_86378/m.241733 type:complete len:202 (-) Transcript_86378:546-1151(-)
MTGQYLTKFIVFHFLHGCCITLGVVFDRNRGRHATHRKSASFVANVDQALDVGLHEGRCHRQVSTIGSNLVSMITKLLDEREQIVPATTVQAERMVSKFIQNFFHLEGCCDCLQQDSGANGSNRNAQILLGHDENIVPQACLQVVFYFRQIEVRTGSLRGQCMNIVEKVKRKVEDRTRGNFSIDSDMSFVQVPSSRTNKQG